MSGQPVDVVPGSEGGIYLIVIDYGKSPVTGCGIEGKYMQPPDGIPEMPVQYFIQFF